MLAVSLDNLLFLLLIAGAALFQLLSKAVTKANKNQSDKTSTPPVPPRPPQVQRAPTESDADRIRKFLEALGQPPSSTPPAPVAPRTDIAPRPLAPVQPPPVVIPRALRLPREQQPKRDMSRREILPPQPPRRVELVRPTAPAPVASAFEVHKEPIAIELEQPTVLKRSVDVDRIAARPITKEPDLKTDILSLLGSKSGLRKAMLLREIFGPPRSLEPVDLVGNA